MIEMTSHENRHQDLGYKERGEEKRREREKRKKAGEGEGEDERN